jgi:hypothetical protein
MATQSLAKSGVKSAGSGRMLVQTLAAHLARLLDPDGGQIEPYAIEQTLIKTLAGPPDRRLRHRYRDTLLGYPLVAARMAPEEAAQRYLDDVLRRRLQLARSLPQHKGHELFVLQCRRGVQPGWLKASLARSKSQPTTASSGPNDFEAVRSRLARLDGSISPKSPAEGTRERLGPIWLQVPGGAAEVAEELSVWQAVTCGPSPLTALGKGPAFDAVCSLTIQALETANAHWSAILCLGISPLDWADAVSVNTAKKASAFRSSVRDAVDGRPETIADWHSAWAAHKVPGFASADAFWASELGKAMRMQPSLALEHINLDDIDLPDGMDQHAKALDSMTFDAMLLLAKAETVIDDFDVWFLREISAGAEIAELAAHVKTKLRAGGGAFDAAAYAASLTRRLFQFARGQEPDDGHPDSDLDL